jgi:hypothetical protein
LLFFGLIIYKKTGGGKNLNKSIISGSGRGLWQKSSVFRRRGKRRITLKLAI